MPFTVANERKSAREYPFVRVGSQQLASTAEPLITAVLRNAEGTPGSAAEILRLLVTALDAVRQKPWR